MGRASLESRLINAGSMSADITSTGLDVEAVDNVGVEIDWTGTPTGTWKVQASNSSTTGSDGKWTDLTFPVASQPAGSDGSALLNLNQFPWKWMRVLYTRASGSGTADVYVYGRTI